MSLRIILRASPDHVFALGDRLDGHVELDLKSASQKETISAVNLQFSCRSKICITRRERTGTAMAVDQGSTTRNYHSTAILFWKTLSLSDPTFEAAASRRGEDGGILSWPFEMQIPLYAEAVPPDVLKAQEGDTFSAEDPLFPTTLHCDTKSPNPPLPDALAHFFANAGVNTDISGNVRYVLHSEVPGLSSGIRSLWMGNKDTEIDVPVLNGSINIDSKQIQWNKLAYEETVYTLRLLPSHSNAKLSFREKSRSFFQRSSLPSMGFRMTFTAPDTLFMDQSKHQPMPFSFNIRRYSPSALILDEKRSKEDSVPTPQAYLKKLTIDLVAHTTVRTSATSSRWNSPKQAMGYADACIFSYKPQSKDSPPMEVPVGDDQWFDFGKLGVNWGHLQEIDKLERFGLVGDFATPNMVRTYGLKWNIRLEIAGEELRWETSREFGGGLPIKLVNGDGSNGGDPTLRATAPAYSDPGPAAWEEKESMSTTAPPVYDERSTITMDEKRKPAS